MRALHSVLVAALLVGALATPAHAQEAPQRHLVYNFTLGVQSDAHDKQSQVQWSNPVNGPTEGSKLDQPGTAPAGPDAMMVTGTGDEQHLGVASDKGTISVDVNGMRSDGGLQVEVSETGQTYRKAAPMVCAVYATTKIACAGEILPEEAAVLSTLSPSFFDPSRLDSKNRWHEDGGVPGVSLEFRASAPSGSVITIDETKNAQVAGGLGGTTAGSATFTYDTVRRVTTALKAYDTERPTQGQPGQYSNIILDITATLASDTGTTAKN
jgi:hypothetical protein